MATELNQNEERALLNAGDLQHLYGFSRPMAYQLLNRADLPTVRFGKRVFMHKELFRQWLMKQASNNG